MTTLAAPVMSGETVRPSENHPPRASASLKPALNAASRDLRSVVPTWDPYTQDWPATGCRPPACKARRVRAGSNAATVMDPCPAAAGGTRHTLISGVDPITLSAEG